MHMAQISEMDGSGLLCGSFSAISSCGKELNTGFRDKASGALFWIPYHDAALELLETWILDLF